TAVLAVARPPRPDPAGAGRGRAGRCTAADGAAGRRAPPAPFLPRAATGGLPQARFAGAA
ncbi:MAG: hypothetical protein KDE03_00595, partial [Rhodobacteraceae bacterium]|nr:hypothetical protein [Paracoccaceae bacterium]